MKVPPLLGFTIGVTAGRRAREQAVFLTRRGGTVVFGPVIASESRAGDADLRAAIEALVERPPDVVLLTTGVGTRAWLAEADSLGLGEELHAALAGAEILARGPKAAGAAVSAGLEVSWRAPGERSSDMVDRLTATKVSAVDGRRVAVQLHGHESPWLPEVVAALGCDVVTVRPYRWRLPDDVGPALALIEATCSHDVDAVTFTSAPAVDNFLSLARSAGLDTGALAALRTGVAAVCVGPVSAEACAGHGIPAIQPDRARTAGMVQALGDHLAGLRREFRAGRHHVVVSRSVAVVDGEPVTLSPRERRVLAALAERPGALLSKTTLLERAWVGESGAEPHAVEAAVARLRHRLGPAGRCIETVVRRGYRVNVN